MPLTMDIFNDDAFGVSELTVAINNPPEGQSAPTLLDSLFDEEGITTTQVQIERDGDALTLVPAADRGAPGDPTTVGKRGLIPFNTIHLPTPWSVMADEVLGIRAFGKTTELETLQERVAKYLNKARQRLEATLRYHRLGAVTGKIMDSNGSSVLLDLHARFGITQNSVAMDLASAGVKAKIKSAIRKSEDALGGEPVTGWLAICGRNFYDALIINADVEKAYDRWQDGQFLREGQKQGFMYADVQWQEYYGKVGGVEFINPDEAYLIPLGVQDLLITRFAPANYVETVGTVGLPFYAKQELMRMGKGVDGEAQSNPLNLCTKPRAIIKLKKGAS